jgi:ATP-binding cassette subfamily B protein
MMNVGTMLMVAHRLSTIKCADQIIVLSHGEIIERGTHTELLELGGRYHHLYTLQYKKEQLQGKK